MYPKAVVTSPDAIALPAVTRPFASTVTFGYVPAVTPEFARVRTPVLESVASPLTVRSVATFVELPTRIVAEVKVVSSAFVMP
ncbi:hypothetical protein D3C87_1883230 [compost metagenome]